MPSIFAVPRGMPVEICFLMWPIRWVVAYLIVNFIAHPLSLKLADKVFGFKLGMKTGLWNPFAFFKNRFVEPICIFHEPDYELHHAIDIWGS